MNGCDDADILIREYVRDCPKFIQCYEFLDIRGNTYTICEDQDGGEWIEE